MDEEDLVGSWVSDPDDLESRQIHGWSEVEFRSDGTVNSTIHPDGEARRKVSRFRTVGDDLYIEDGPKEKCVAFRFTQDGRLILGLGEGESRYRRA